MGAHPGETHHFAIAAPAMKSAPEKDLACVTFWQNGCALGMGLSGRGYARHRKELGLSGGSETGVRKALAEGRISLEPDGSIDPAKADALWGANSSRSPADGTTPRANGNGQVSDLTRVRIEKLGLDSQKAQLAVGRLRGELVDRERAHRTVFAAFRQEWEASQAWPPRVAPVLAAELEVDEGVLLRILKEYVDEHLRELAKFEALGLE